VKWRCYAKKRQRRDAKGDMILAESQYAFRRQEHSIAGRSVVRLGFLRDGARRFFCSSAKAGLVVLWRSQRSLPQWELSAAPDQKITPLKSMSEMAMLRPLSSGRIN